MSNIQNLHHVVRGKVWLPGEADFDTTRLPWNRAVEQPVDAVVEAADAADVADLVRYARANGLTLTTQPNGHGATGRTDGTVLLRTRRLDALDIDAGNRRARIGAGVSSGRLQQAAAAYGLTGLPGSSPVVSVTGVALGGGLSWFGRKHGWVADSVRAFDIVDAEGSRRHITADTEPDLFWALRGGGGDFAVVTALELELHPAPHVYGGRMMWAGAHASAVLSAYQQIVDKAPDELTLWFNLVHFPGADPMVTVDLTHLGPEAEARDLIAELDRLPQPIADTRRVMTVAELGGITGEPTDPSAGLSRAELLTTLDETLLAEPIAPLLSVQVRHLGGAFAQPSDSPHGPLTEPYALYLFGLAQDPAGVLVKQAALAETLPVSGRKPFTFLNPAETVADAFTPEVVERLRQIKSQVDPGQLFRSNFPV
ncbi:FAD/FMN-containing dehydrogenase [Hamadaea flava]|uniref:FAD-binding oxidoreductase n=1 Tax=Hamadaea flava TaxID=1742688 RepID=A0ABV8M0D8_9ACTN|nr:FAD-binding oxidoreductase [Hamadaea flava]MCP2326939.1 FAD/FMN-containing dehydrogenase [Hamadaea flava]